MAGNDWREAYANLTPFEAGQHYIFCMQDYHNFLEEAENERDDIRRQHWLDLARRQAEKMKFLRERYGQCDE